MRKPFIMVLAVFLALVFVSPALAGPTVSVDSRTLVFDVPPVTQDGRTLVPLRTIFEALGASVEWDANTRTVVATKGPTAIKLTIGSKTAYVSGQPILLDVPGTVVGGRTLVPLRFVGEGLGADVVYHANTNTVSIQSGSVQPDSTVRPKIKRVGEDTAKANLLARIDGLLELVDKQADTRRKLINRDYQNALQSLNNSYHEALGQAKVKRDKAKQDCINTLNEQLERVDQMYERYRQQFGDDSYLRSQAEATKAQIRSTIGSALTAEDEQFDNYVTKLDSWYATEKNRQDKWEKDSYRVSDERCSQLKGDILKLRVLVQNGSSPYPVEVNQLIEEFESLIKSL